MTITIEPRRAFDDDRDRSGCPARRHGTRSARLNAGCECEDAIQAVYVYNSRHYAGRIEPTFVSVVPTQRRIRAMFAAGHSAEKISECSGVPEQRIYRIGETARKLVRLCDADAITAAFILLADQDGDCELTRARAERFGHHPESAWIDIDDLEEVPVLLPKPEDVVDQVLVARALNGDKKAIAELHDGAEMRAYIEAFLMRPGYTLTELAEALGCERDEAIPDMPAFVEAYLTRGGTVTGLTRVLGCSGTTARRHAQRMIAYWLGDVARGREANGESCDDIAAYAVAVAAGYISWGDHANTGKSRGQNRRGSRARSAAPVPPMQPVRA